MKSIRDEAARMRDLADALEAMGGTEPVTDPDITPIEALARMRLLLGDCFISVNVATFDWYSGSNAPTRGRWSVYDGKRSYQGGTLQAALNALIAAHTPNEDVSESERAELRRRIEEIPNGALPGDAEIMAALDFGKTAEQHLKHGMAESVGGLSTK